MITALIVVALAFVQPAFAQEKDAAYFCIEETIAGLKFNEATKCGMPKQFDLSINS
jgi:hypothetical protein